MNDQRMNLVSPTGSVITATLERLSGRAIIVSDSARKDELGGIDFDYEGTTDIDWDNQRTATRDDERIFLDEEGHEFLESELRLVPAENAGVPEASAPDSPAAPKLITITIEGGVIHGIEGIPPGLTVRVLDFDIEGVEPGRITTTASGEKACVSDWESEAAP
jgi:hypothetical protein